MSERITRAQAEAAMDQLPIAKISTQAVAKGILRAYLAQRPDEETVFRGHKSLDVMSGWAASALRVKKRGEAERILDDWVAAIRAAMYQPEED